MQPMAAQGYKPEGGKHPETATVRNLLAWHGMKVPHTGKPPSEAMILGISGGLGACYILWEFKKRSSADMVLAFKYRSNYPAEVMSNLCKRMGTSFELKETSGARAAGSHLESALGKGLPAIAWIDAAHLPHRKATTGENGCQGWVVSVFGKDSRDGSYLVEDLGRKPFKVTPEELAASRSKIPSHKNRLLVIKSAGKFKFERAVEDGISDCIRHLSSKSDSFGLPAWKKWATMLTDHSNKKAWPVVFQERRGLYSTLCGVYDGIRHRGTEGYGLRNMYADFLDEAAVVLNRSALKDAATKFRRAGKHWVKFAKTALPASISPFRQARDLMARRHKILSSRGQAGLDELRKVGDQMENLRARLDRDFPMHEEATEVLFQEMQEALLKVHAAETEALQALKECMQ